MRYLFCMKYTDNDGANGTCNYYVTLDSLTEETIEAKLMELNFELEKKKKRTIYGPVLTSIVKLDD